MKKYLFFLILFFCAFAISFSQWEEVNNGLSGATIFSMADDSSNLYISTKDNGIYYSTDSAKYWTLYCKTDISFSEIAMIDSVIIGIADKDDSWYYSHDSGKTFSKSTFEGLPEILGLYRYENKIYAGTSNGLYLLFDSTKTMQRISPSGTTILDFYKNDNQNFIFQNDGLYSRLDSSSKWNKIWSGNNPRHGCLNLFNNQIFVANKKSIFISTNKGTDWNEKKIPLNRSDNFIENIIVTDSTIIVGTYKEGIYITSDNGNTWQQSNNGLQFNQIFSLKKFRNYIFAINPQLGISISSDVGITWNKADNGLYQNNITCLSVKNDTIYGSSTQNDIFFSTNNGQKWEIMTNDFQFCNSLILVNNRIIAGNYDGLFISENNGKSWVIDNMICQNPNIVFNNNIIYVAGCGALALSSDFGKSWSKVNDSNTVGSTRFLGIDGDNIFVAGDSLFLTTDKGNSWKVLFGEDLPYKALLIHNNKIYISTSQILFTGDIHNMYFSPDYGKNWQIFSQGFSNFFINAIVSWKDTVFAGTEEGVYFYSEQEQKWMPFNNGLKNKNITSLAVNGGYLFAGTASNGIFRLNLENLVLGKEDEKNSIAGQVTINPNPAVNEISVNLQCFQDSRIFISIVNVFGQIVYHTETNSHDFIKINTENFNSGLYYFQVKSKTKFSTEKFVIIK